MLFLAMQRVGTGRWKVGTCWAKAVFSTEGLNFDDENTNLYVLKDGMGMGMGIAA